MFLKLYHLWQRASMAGAGYARSETERKANRVSNQFIMLYTIVVAATALLFSASYFFYNQGQNLYLVYPLASWGYGLLLILLFWLKARTGMMLLGDVSAYLLGIGYISFLIVLSGRGPWFYLFLIPLSYLPFFLVRLHYLLRFLGNFLCYCVFAVLVYYVYTHEPLLPLKQAQETQNFWVSVISLPVLFLSVNLILYFQNEKEVKEFFESLLERTGLNKSTTALAKARVTMAQIQIISIATTGLVMLPMLAVCYPIVMGIDADFYDEYAIFYSVLPYLLLGGFLAMFRWRQLISIPLQMIFTSLVLIASLLGMTLFSGIQAYMFLVPTLSSLFFFTRVIKNYLAFLIGLFITVSFGAGLYIEKYVEPLFPLPGGILNFSNILLPTLVLLLTASITFLFARETGLAEEGLEAERDRSEKLLLNILPVQVAEELKEKGASTPVRFESVSVLFTDFVGFSIIAEKISSEELIDELDKCFSYFDAVTRKYNLEKIKTIGDSYMLAGGLPDRNNTHAIDCCLAALEIQAFMNQMQEIKEQQKLPYWQLRLGIHTGPLVAGVIGEMKFAYDVFGDTVNSASRMESSGIAGRINISSTTHEQVKDFFQCSYRGRVKAKNKGMVDMYFVEGILPALSVNGEGRVPNDEFRRLYDGLS